MVQERLKALREIMKEKKIDAYIIPSADFHQSEYVGDYFKAREYISGFTGSAGTVVVFEDEAGLWTDGRYFLQAENQLKGSGVDLFKMGEENVPTYEDYIYNKLKKGQKLGFDGRVISAKEGLSLKTRFGLKEIELEYGYDLLEEVWKDRPALSTKKAFILDVKYAGLTYAQKLENLRNIMKNNEVGYHIISSLDDIAWLFNIRGNDVDYNPVVLSYAVIAMDKVYLFIDENKLSDSDLQELKKENTEIKPYFEIYDYIKNFEEAGILLDSSKLNYTLYQDIKDSVIKLDILNPTTMMKACKNKVELENARKCHIRDGAYITKFLYWLKKNVGKIEMSELSVSDKLEQIRRTDDKFMDLSFNTIAGYKENGAIIHYSATKESDKKIEANGMLLVDSGVQYMDGTTDITRTIAMGSVEEEQKRHFTLVLKGMLSLSMAKFLYGSTGTNIDILARKALWDNNLDYKHGTGHGIGFYLNVHEGPHSIRWQYNPYKLEEGMLVSNEPGLYVAGSHGIRIENEIFVKKSAKNDFGQFMEFEVLTLAPIDLELIIPELLSKEEKDYLNKYHKEVFEKVSPLLEEDEKAWLKEYTKEI